MGKYTTAEVVLLFLYITGAIALLITSYVYYLKKFKRNKLEALNQITLETSIENRFTGKTQFLIIAPKKENVIFELLDLEENKIDDILTLSEIEGQFPVKFDASKYEAGKYFLYLKTDNTKILRKITILKS